MLRLRPVPRRRPDPRTPRRARPAAPRRRPVRLTPIDASCSILLIGFEPFTGHPVNPSGEVARSLDGATLAGHRIVGLVVPVDRSAVWAPVEAALAEHRPDFVLATGVSGRPHFSVEAVARNLDDYPMPDNAGHQPIAQSVIPDAPDVLLPGVDPADLAHWLWLDGVEAQLSRDAGTYLCNHLYYRLLHHAAGSAQPYRAIFVHLPPLSVSPLDETQPAVIQCLTRLLTAP